MIGINTAVLDGLEGKPVKVEVEILNGIPSFIVIGLGDVVIKEAGERIKAAIKSAGFEYPKGKIVVNLSPANLRKRGSGMELAVAIGILAASGQIPVNKLDGYGFFGELSLSGAVLPVKGVLPMAISLERTVGQVVMPKGNEKESLLIDQKKFLISNLAEVVDILKGRKKEYFCDNVDLKHKNQIQDVDFKQVRGQEEAKRAITIAAAGCHGTILIGGPGSGKSMIAKRVPTVLPPMTQEEMIKTWIIYSSVGKNFENFNERPFRSPYYKISMAGLLGGGNQPLPGEITLAHNGVLFLDELGEYSPRVLDGLRTPLEEKKIVINRHGKNTTFPADFLLIAASNPCKCGNLGSPTKECICSSQQIDIYKRKLMGPLSDRIHLHVYVPEVSYDEYCDDKTSSSQAMREQVMKARQIQKERFSGMNVRFNSALEGELLHKLCPMTKEAQKVLKMAYCNLNLNPRTCENTIKIARTIADIEGETFIDEYALSEALSYRGIEKIYGGGC